MISKIDYLKAIYESAIAAERTAHKTLCEAESQYHAALVEAFPIKVGDVLIHKKTRAKIIIRRVYVPYGSVWLDYSKPKKDGTFGVRTHEFFDALSNWEVEK